jgi:hypothetical protein
MPILARDDMRARPVDGGLRGAFRTHLAYLEAFARIATGDQTFPATYRALDGRLARCQHPPIPAPIAGLPQVRRSLESAWGTELLLLMSRRLLTGDEIVGVSNNWNVVQAYYALYHATQAVLVARGFPRPDSHPKTQRMFFDLWGALSEDFAPWSLSVGPTGHQPVTIQLDPTLHPWTAVDARGCWTIACKALQTTRGDALAKRTAEKREEKRKARKKEWIETRAKRPRAARDRVFPLPLLTVEEKAKVNAATRNYTLLDYLYRLRVRANYEDSAMFTDGPEDAGESELVRRCLLRLVSTSLYVAERVLCTAPNGKPTLDDWARRWCRANVPAEMPFGITQRVDHWPGP